MHLYEMFDNIVKKSPGNRAVFYQEKYYTYEDLEENINKVANSLVKLGVKNQDRVAVMLKNSIENLTVFWAVQKLSAVYAPINTDMTEDSVRYCLNDIEPGILFFDGEKRDFLKNGELSEETITIGIDSEADLVYSDLLKNDKDYSDTHKYSDDDLAIILYTSGTGGKPKGVPRTHKNEYAATMAHIIQNRYNDGDSTIGAVQLYHTMGMRSFLSMMFLGGTYYSHPYFDADEILFQINNYSISTLFLRPTQYHDILAETISSENTSEVRVVSYASAPMKKSLIEKIDNYFEPELFVNHYGSTEVYTFTISCNVKSKPWVAGKAGLHNQVKIASLKDKKRIHTREDEIGEIIVSLNSDEAFRGYWNRPDETAKVIKDGWFHTGDIGMYDEEGDLNLIGRLDEVIISSGENIHPYQIEAIVNEHPKVLECIVIGEPDERLGELLSAFVISTDDKLNFLDLDKFVRSSGLPPYLRPMKYTFVDEFPKSSKGTVDRKLLKQEYVNET